jgi:hypothetical protein
MPPILALPPPPRNLPHLQTLVVRSFRLSAECPHNRVHRAFTGPPNERAPGDGNVEDAACPNTATPRDSLTGSAVQAALEGGFPEPLQLDLLAGMSPELPAAKQIEKEIRVYRILGVPNLQDREVEICQVDTNPEQLVDQLQEQKTKIGKRWVKKYLSVRFEYLGEVQSVTGGEQ